MHRLHEFLTVTGRAEAHGVSKERSGAGESKAPQRRVTDSISGPTSLACFEFIGRSSRRTAATVTARPGPSGTEFRR